MGHIDTLAEVARKYTVDAGPNISISPLLYGYVAHPIFVEGLCREIVDELKARRMSRGNILLIPHPSHLCHVTMLEFPVFIDAELEPTKVYFMRRIDIFEKFPGVGPS